MTMKQIYRALLMLAAVFSASTFAAVGPYKVVLIHGFQPDQLQSRPDHEQVAQDGANYWQDYWLQYADARIDWPANERIEGKIASDYLWPALKNSFRARNLFVRLPFSHTLYRRFGGTLPVR